MKKRFDVVVVGAGIAGLTVAALLAKADRGGRLRLQLIDAADRPAWRGDGDVDLRVSAIATGSAALLDRVGAWQRIAGGRACAYEKMCVWDGSRPVNGGATLRFDAAEFAVPRLGFIVENRLVQHALLEVLDAAGVDMAFGCPLESLDGSGHSLRLGLGIGRDLRADLVIAADGSSSFVRNAAGIPAHERPYAQSAFVTHLRPELPHRATAWQRFLPDGPLGMLPLSDGRISVVWSTRKEHALQAMNAGDAELGRMLSEASDWVLGEMVPEGPRGTFPLSAMHADRYVLPGLALLGDAAHAIHPLAGQGANLGLRDAEALARVVTEAVEGGGHPGDLPVLRRYERGRRGDNALMLHFMTGLNSLFASDSAFVRQLRTAGMRLFNHSGPIRDRIVGIAIGQRP